MNQATAALSESVAPRKGGLVAVVVTYNRQEQLCLTVPRLLAEAVDRVIVVDNASTDGTPDLLASLADPRLHVVRLAVNQGGAGGFEQGLRLAFASYDPDWCVVMDDDARPEPGTFARFKAEAPALLAAGWEGVGAAVFYPDGHICEMNRPSRNPFWNVRTFLRTLMGGGRGGFHVTNADFEATEPAQVHAVSFVGLFLSRAAIGRVGFPDGRLFIYGDDVLYTLKLSAAGGAIAFAPWLRFEHDCSTFVRGGKHLHRPLWKVYYNYRNGLLAYRAAAGPVLFWPVLLLLLPKWLLKSRQYGPDQGVFLRLLAMACADALRRKLSRSHQEVVTLAESGTQKAI